jgi:hypothetical protein
MVGIKNSLPWQDKLLQKYLPQRSGAEPETYPALLVNSEF